MKISAIVAGVIGGVSVLALDSNSAIPIIICFICLGYLVFCVCVKWDELMRYWVSKGYWSFDPEDKDEYIDDIWEYKYGEKK